MTEHPSNCHLFQENLVDQGYVLELLKDLRFEPIRNHFNCHSVIETANIFKKIHFKKISEGCI